MATWMIYGANGYTGSRIAKQAARLGHTPVLAGRNEQALYDLGKATSCPYRVFDLDDDKVVQKMIQDMDLILNCAGPFVYTAPSLVQACLNTQTHYLDITGEIEVFEYCARHHTQAESQNLLLCPGVGFDVVPSDHLAKALHEHLPDAQQLHLGFHSLSPLSPGTTKTMLLGLGRAPQVRLAGKRVASPLGVPKRLIDFGEGPIEAMAISWGDIATAWYSTGIPNIEVYMPIPVERQKGFKILSKLAPLLKGSWAQSILSRLIDYKVKGPSDLQLQQDKVTLWGEVENANKKRISARFQVPNGYQLTIHAALAYTEWLLTQDQPPKGYQTPTQAFPAAIFWNISGVENLLWDGLNSCAQKTAASS
jgi:short subunit dehydrogenase-like uncharacterized protein